MQNVFTSRRVVHQAVTCAEVTGELPVAALLAGAPHSDSIRNTGDPAKEDALGYRAWTFGWAGCLDAPDTMPAGSVLPVNIPEHVGGYGYEGNVTRTACR